MDMNGSWSLERSAVAAELKRFIAEKCAQVRAEVRAPVDTMVPESRSLFAAAEQGDWPAVFASLEAMHKAMREGWKHPRTVGVVYPVEWAVLNEIGAALEAFAAGEKYAAVFGRDIIACIPPGSIYFGGTDPGRFLVTALSASHVNGDPFFTLTQNALIDRQGYLRYVRGMYGSLIYIPTDQDAIQATDDYQQDARRREKEGKLLPGECFEQIQGKVEFRGQLSVMAVNAALSRLLFEKNPEHEFCVEESFPLEWMYPHLSPNGLILKIDRQRLAELSPEVVQRDRDYWTRYICPMIGDWLQYTTSLEEIVDFVQTVDLRHDLSGFKGDIQFLQDDYARKAFAKLRSSIGGVYAWRAHQTSNPVEKERMLKEAEFAFRQAFALCQSSPEAVFRYMNVLLSQKRFDDAILLTEAAVKIEARTRSASSTVAAAECASSPVTSANMPESARQPVSQLENLLEQLRRMKK